MPRKDLPDRSIEGWDKIINPPKMREVKFADPKESAQNGWELSQNTWVLLRRHKHQPEELSAEDCLKQIEQVLTLYATRLNL